MLSLLVAGSLLGVICESEVGGHMLRNLGRLLTEYTGYILQVFMIISSLLLVASIQNSWKLSTMSYELRW
jgi:hypothetical protein